MNELSVCRSGDEQRERVVLIIHRFLGGEAAMIEIAMIEMWAIGTRT